MSSTPDLVCVGHIVKEMIYFPDRVKGPVLGGPPAYCAVAAACQGTRTGIVTKIGPDMPGELLTPFVESGVDTTGIIKGSRTTQSELIYDAKGNKEIRYPAKAELITARDIPDVYRNCRMMYICTMDNDVKPEDIPAVLSCSACRAVDLGGYGGVHMSKANRDAVPSLSGLACRVSKNFDIVKASDEDTKAIFGKDEPDEAVDRLLACGPKVVIITLGKKGALVGTSCGHKLIPPFSCNAVDSTGCGDTFMAGFLSEYLRSADPVKSARWSSATSACVIEKTGGVHKKRMPDFNTVKTRK